MRYTCSKICRTILGYTFCGPLNSEDYIAGDRYCSKINRISVKALSPYAYPSVMRLTQRNCYNCKDKNFLIECVCGCGGILQQRNKQGKILRFIISHNTKGKLNPYYGKKHSQETRQKMSISRSGERNYLYGKHRSEETKRKISRAKKGKKRPLEFVQRISGPNNHMWKENPRIDALHSWVKRYLPRPEVCPICQINTNLELCNISPRYNPATYTRDLNNWIWLCRKCHMISDDRILNLELSPYRKMNKKLASKPNFPI